ncbi:piggyBac transposable element-derived protein 3-like [Macrosteles quadrilineatus]|uniref:piggyBac transposable element-derived protein 3-like n=1 Tax=Macrosteles quadrilineatus TaxID=74068 RepID=UPI0023E131C0|nr:piggyBac transposable element-derived protein 3-like [Macrosteles quadrilineatus]
MEQYLGIHMISSIVKMPSYRMYWGEGTRYAPIAEAMSRNRFETIRAYIHVNDNTNLPDGNDPAHDKLFKIRPLIDAVRDNMKKVPLDSKVSIDELIIPFKGRSHMKQYNPKKPHKWGIKVFALASKCGIIHDYEIYVGKGTVTETKLGICGDIVVRLVDIVPKDKNYKLFIDNWFNSHRLLCHLKEVGLLAVGTIRPDRIGRCPFTKDKDLLEEGGGSMDVKLDTENNIIACKWADNKTVCLASTYVGAEPVDEVMRWSTAQKQRVAVQRPAIVREYNEAMGGVDLHDMLVELYRIDIKVKRYYMRIVMHLLDMSVVNAWIVYRRDLSLLEANSKPMPLIKFKSQLACSLLQPKQVKKRGRPSIAEPPTRKKMELFNACKTCE